MSDTKSQTGSERTAVGGQPFQFRCHPGVSCYLVCCHKVELRLFPVDVLRLKKNLDLHSTEFMEQYTSIGPGAHPYFPAVMLKMADRENYPCPFLIKEGCSVYADRPSACRTYPLERAVEKSSKRGQTAEMAKEGGNL